MKKIICGLLVLLIIIQLSFTGITINAMETASSKESDVVFTQDHKIDTYWQSGGVGDSIYYDCKGSKLIKTIDIRFSNSLNKQYEFIIESSNDGTTFEKILEGKTVFKTDYHTFAFDEFYVRYIRITQTGNENIRISELEFNRIVPEIAIETGKNKDISIKETIIASNFDDIESEICQKAALFLTAPKLQIIKPVETNIFGAEENVTYKEFYESIKKILNISDEYILDTLYEGALIENLKSANYEILDKIAVLKKYPTNILTLKDATSVLMTAMGYNPLIQSKGDNAYASDIVMGQVGLIKNIHRKLYDDMDKATYAVLLYNALNSEIFQQTIYGGKTDYQTGALFMEHYLKLYKKTGILLKSNLVMVGVDKSEYMRNIQIDEIELLCEDIETNNLLGMNVTGFYFDDDDTYELAYITPNNSDFSYVAFSAYAIESITQNGGGFVFEYYNENGKLKKYSTVAEPMTFYNDVYYSALTLDDMKHTNGNIVLMDRNGDGAYDIIKVLDFKDAVISKVYTDSNLIICSNGQFDTIDLTESKDKFIVFKNGKLASLSDLKDNDVISVAQSKESIPYYLIEARNDAVSGEINEIYDEDEEKYVEIKGEKYKLSTFYKDNYRINLRDGGLFLVNIFGEIVYKTLKTGTEKYESTQTKRLGMLVNMKKESKSINWDVKVQVYTLQGNLEVYKLTDKILYNNNLVVSDKLIKSQSNLDKPLWDDTNPVTMQESRQMIECIFNEEGLISGINSAKLATTDASKPVIYQNDIFGIIKEVSAKKYNNTANQRLAANEFMELDGYVTEWEGLQVPDGRKIVNELVEPNKLTIIAPRGLRRISEYSGAVTTVQGFYSSGGFYGDSMILDFPAKLTAPVIVLPIINKTVTEYKVTESDFILSNLEDQLASKNTTEYSWEMEAYNYTGDFYADYLVFYDTASDTGKPTVSSEAPTMLVTKISEVLSSDGESSIKVTGVVSGKETYYLFEDESSLIAKYERFKGTENGSPYPVAATIKIKVGDIIRAGDIKGGFVKGIRVIFDAERIAEDIENATDRSDAYVTGYTTLDLDPYRGLNNAVYAFGNNWCTFGKIIKISDDGEYGLVQSNLKYFSGTSTSTNYYKKLMTRPDVVLTVKLEPKADVYEFNTSTGKTIMRKNGDIRIGDEIYVRNTKWVFGEIIVYKFE